MFLYIVFNRAAKTVVTFLGSITSVTELQHAVVRFACYFFKCMACFSFPDSLFSFKMLHLRLIYTENLIFYWQSRQK